MTRRQDVALRLAAVFVVTLVVSPFVGVLMPREPFHRVMTRIAQVSFVIAFLVGAGKPRAWQPRIRAVGARGPDRFRRCATGVVVALALFGLIVAVSVAAGGRTLTDAVPKRPLLVKLGMVLVAAAVISVFEEILFRGFLKDLAGGLVSAFVYAAVHYFRPLGGSAGAGTELDPLLGVRSLPMFVEAWTDWHLVVVGIGTLFVFGLALNRMRERTGTLYLGIGVHGGLVLALALYRRWVAGQAAGDRWIWGGARLHDGVVGMIGLLVLLALAYWCPLPKWMTRNVAGGPDAAGAG